MKPPAASAASHHRTACGSVAVGALLLGLAACASAPPPRFHTLLGAEIAPVQAAGPRMAWELLAVTIPAQVDQPQFVLRRADGTLALMENERWVAPLADELHAALRERLVAALGTTSVAPGSGHKAWRIRVDVRRFDSTLDRSAGIAVHWGLLPDATGSAALRCNSVVVQPVGTGFAALAAGHRQAVANLAEGIAATLRSLDAGQLESCPEARPKGSGVAP